MDKVKKRRSSLTNINIKLASMESNSSETLKIYQSSANIPKQSSNASNNTFIFMPHMPNLTHLSNNEQGLFVNNSSVNQLHSEIAEAEKDDDNCISVSIDEF
jgi:hypothetical protein